MLQEPDTHPPLRVGLVGYAFMGAIHSQAWRTADRFFDLPRRPELVAITGRNQQAASLAGARMGWQDVEPDWQRLIQRDDIDLVDICSPGDTHAEIAIAALETGKHVLCEKPLANSVAEAEQMAKAADAAAQRGVFAMCGYSYRRTPALALARRLVQEGRLGTIRQVRAQYLQDWLSEETAPLTWRLDKTRAGSGALGDIGAHIIDAAQWITGQKITGVSALMETFVRERPLAGELVGLGGHGDASSTGPVTVDDAAIFSARFEQGSIGVFEATRAALGRRNAMRIEVNGSSGSLAFDFEDMNFLQFYNAQDSDGTAGFHRIMVTEPEHPYTKHWWPTGHGLGYEHLFTHEVADLVTAIGAGTQPSPSFGEALQVQYVLNAVEQSAGQNSIWTATSGSAGQLSSTARQA